MATSVSRPLPCCRHVVLVSADVWYEVTGVPAGARKVSFNPTANAARVGWESVAGTELVDAAAYAASDLSAPLVADVYTETIRAPGGRTSYFLSSASAGTLVTVVVEG